MDAVDAFAKKKKINANDLLAVMGVETVGTMSPSIKNPKSSASGLIQFMDSTAKELGTTTSELRKMTRADQMKYVEKYFEMNGLRTGADIGEIYQKVFMPNRDKNMLARRGSVEYSKNYQLDVNKDGVITRDDLAEIARQRGLQMGLGMDLKPGTANPARAGTANTAIPKPEDKKSVVSTPSGPTQTYNSKLKDVNPEASAEKKSAMSTPTNQQQGDNEGIFEMIKRQTMSFEAMLRLQQQTASNTGKIVKQGK
jgi:hypothetical protein